MEKMSLNNVCAQYMPVESRAKIFTRTYVLSFIINTKDCSLAGKKKM